MFLVHVFMLFTYISEWDSKKFIEISVYAGKASFGVVYFLQRRVLQSFAMVWAWLIAFCNGMGKNVGEGFSTEWFSLNTPFPLSVWHLILYLLHSSWPKSGVLLFRFSREYTSSALGLGNWSLDYAMKQYEPGESICSLYTLNSTKQYLWFQVPSMLSSEVHDT